MNSQIAPVPHNEAARIDALRSAMCAYVPREDQFDRITRVAQRMMNVPIALISIIEDDEQWFRSAQGLEVPETTRDISFCGHAIMESNIFHVADTHADARFSTNPLVVGSPYIRSYCGWPLEIAPSLRVGTLCVLDTIPRTFTKKDHEILSDLAHMVESELRINALTDNQKAMMVQASRAERKSLLDLHTGCWSEAGFLELLRRTLNDVLAGSVHAALCGFHLENDADFDMSEEQGGPVAKAMLIAQFIRQRLPPSAVLCRLPGGRGCILFVAKNMDLVREQVATFLQEPGYEPVAGMVFPQKMQLAHSGLKLGKSQASQDVELLFETVMGRLAEGAGMSSILR